MATVGSETRKRTHLPDIFRTINGISLDLGPFNRLRDGKPPGIAGSEVIYEKPSLPWSYGRRIDDVGMSADGVATGLASGGICPRIILRDALGRELDTFTTLQEAIYRAKWNVQQTGQARVPLEWRLPKAPPPARPDLTRTFPPLKHPPIVHDVGTRERPEFSHSRVLEFDVEDVGFVRESLQYLPYAPSLSFLRQELLVGPKTYFQIVGTLLLHKRILTQTEKRNAIYNFPGLCTGCMRMGLCYGCQKNPQLHYHEDRPVRTGGGFTYFKKDRPENEISAKHPMNWKIKHPEQALKMLMEEYAGVELEGALSDEVKRHLDLQHRAEGHTDAPVRSTIPDFAAEMKKLLSKEELRDGVLSDDHVAIAGDVKGDLEGEGHSEKRGRGRGHHPGDGDGAEYGYGQGQEDGTESDLEGYQGHYGSTVESEMEQHERMAVPTHSDRPQRKKKKRLDGKNSSEAIEDEAEKDQQYDKDGNRIRKYRKNESGERVTDTDSSNEDTEGETTSRGRRKQRLYKTPPAFKLKKSPTRRIEARSPFSTDRKYTLPKGKGLDIKKSDKKLTEFKDFKGGDVSWKEPKKFELKRKDTKTTKFWSGPPKSHATKGTKSNSPARQAHRVPSPRPVISPDSGLDSELLTVLRKAQKRRPKSRKKSSKNKIIMQEDIMSFPANTKQAVAVSANQNLAVREWQSQSDEASSETTNQSFLDNFYDTATQYYTNEKMSENWNKLKSRKSKRGTSFLPPLFAETGGS